MFSDPAFDPFLDGGGEGCAGGGREGGAGFVDYVGAVGSNRGFDIGPGDRGKCG